jgi:hypothetical protein
MAPSRDKVLQDGAWMRRNFGPPWPASSRPPICHRRLQPCGGTPRVIGLGLTESSTNWKLPMEWPSTPISTAKKAQPPTPITGTHAQAAASTGPLWKKSGKRSWTDLREITQSYGINTTETSRLFAARPGTGVKCRYAQTVALRTCSPSLVPSIRGHDCKGNEITGSSAPNLLRF